MAFALLAPKPSSHPFKERQLYLNEPVKIGRSVAKIKSASNNGIFDCKVLSRSHALMWYCNGKFMLQDTKSSNGTYVNSVRLSRGAEESEPCEIKSGDTLQFGVEVVENTKNVTHGCIVGFITLFNEDGTEVSESEDSTQGLFNLITDADKTVLPHELVQLAQYLHDALHREQMLENKLAALQRMIGNCHVVCDDSFQGFVQEDKLLSRIETLENQLTKLTKEVSHDETRTEKMDYEDERLQYETSAKETLQIILKEKIDVLQKCGDLERLLSNTEDEYAYLKSVHDKAQGTIQELVEKSKQDEAEIERLKGELSHDTKNRENIEQVYMKKVDELKTLLGEAEKRGSSAAVEVETLQAECDSTKKQLQLMKTSHTREQEGLQGDNDSENNNDNDNDNENDNSNANENDNNNDNENENDNDNDNENNNDNDNDNENDLLESSNLKTQSDVLQEENDSLKTKISSFHLENENLRAEAEALQKENDSLKTKITALHLERDNLKEQADAVEGEIGAQKTKLISLHLENNNFREEFSTACKNENLSSQSDFGDMSDNASVISESGSNRSLSRHCKSACGSYDNLLELYI